MDFVKLEITGHIGIITVDRPPLNSVNMQTYKEIIETFNIINGNDEIYVVILTAKGKAFMAGNDLNDFRGPCKEDYVNYAKLVNEGLAAPYNCRVPVIGAINGLALGTGTAIASCCDLLVAAEEALFGITEINFSLVSGPCHISRLLPETAARNYCMRGKRITAKELAAYGAICKIVHKDELLNTAMEIAEEIASKPPLAMIVLKRAMNANQEFRIMEKYALEMSYTQFLVNTEDFEESIAAFFEKRQPIFKRK